MTNKEHESNHRHDVFMVVSSQTDNLSTSKKLKMKVAQQNEISIYTILAMAQSFFWLFIFPDLCKPLWPETFGRIQSHFIQEVILNHCTTAVFILYTLCTLPIYYLQLPFFEQFKISPDKKWAWQDNDVKKREEFWKMVTKSIKLCAFNLLFLVTTATVANRYLMDMIGLPGPSFDVDNWPSKMDMARQIIMLTLIHEFLFHTAHKIVHIYPSLYKYHKVHHEYKNNVVIAAQHNHPIDYVISIALPVLAALTIVQPHSFTQCQWAIYILYTNLDDHVGYSFPFSPVRWFPFASLTQEHEFHHSVNIGCYSSKLDVFERLFKTNSRFYPWEDKRCKTIRAKKFL